MQKLVFGQPEQKDSFVFEFSGKDGNMITFQIDSNSRTEILQQFQRFLTACGYTFFGTLKDHVEPKENVNIWGEAAKEKKWVNEGYNVKGYELDRKPLHEPKWDFSNIPNNNWPFGSLKSEPLPTLTTVDLSALTSTDYSKINQFPTMAPLTTEQVYAWKTEMPGTLGGAKVKF